MGNHTKSTVELDSAALPFGEGNGEKFAPDSWRKLLLSELLKGIHLQSSVLYRPEFRAPWGVRIDETTAQRLGVPENLTVFHIVASGSCWMDLIGVRERLLLSEGDFVVITRGHPHILRDSPDTPAINQFDLLKRFAPGKDGVFRAGGNGSVTRFVCGGMQFEDAATHPLLAVLPPVLHVKAAAQSNHPCVRMTVRHIVAELESNATGAAEVVTRLADILFILAVRSYFEQNSDASEFGWLSAVSDQRIGPAITLLHTQLEKHWTIETLSRSVGMSRSAFADRFTRLVCEPPLRYLTRVRINAAARRMRLSDDGLSAVAAAVGYESHAAFARAFRRHTGMTPGMYRKTIQPAGPTQKRPSPGGFVH